MTPDEFATWMKAHAARLRAAHPARAADEIGDAVIAVDGRLGVEVSEPPPDEAAADRELIITAFSDRSAVPLARTLAQAIAGLPGWEVIALRPPRGFDCTVAIGDTELPAAELRFLPDPRTPRAIQLVVPTVLLDRVAAQEAEELAWLVVEAGIGEELASVISEINLVEKTRGVEGQPLTALAEHVQGLRPIPRGP